MTIANPKRSQTPAGSAPDQRPGLPRRAVRFLTAAGRRPAGFSEIKGDVGTRRYFRGKDPAGKVELLALYSDGDEGVLDRWMTAHRILAPVIRVPEIYVADRTVPAALIEDFGKVDLSSQVRRDPKRAPELFLGACETAALLRKIPPVLLGDLNPPLDAALFRRELDVTRSEFFTGLLGQKWDPRRRALFDEWVFRLGERLDALPRLTCHRDFHGNNLFAAEKGTIGVIDFQDLRPGPLGYDLASLLFERDALGVVDDELVEDAIRGYARALGLGVSDLTRAIGLCRIQRGWKAAGTFARQVRRGRRGYSDFLRRQLDALGSLFEESGDFGTSIPDFLRNETARRKPATVSSSSSKRRHAAPKKKAPAARHSRGSSGKIKASR